MSLQETLDADLEATSRSTGSATGKASDRSSLETVASSPSRNRRSTGGCVRPSTTPVCATRGSVQFCTFDPTSQLSVDAVASAARVAHRAAPAFRAPAPAHRLPPPLPRRSQTAPQV